MSWPSRRHRTLVVGFLQDRKSLAPIAKALRADRFLRAAVLQSAVGGKTVSADWIAFRYLATVFIALSAVAPILIGENLLPKVPTHMRFGVGAIVVVVWILCAWVASRILRWGVEKRILRLLRRWILPGEGLVAVSTNRESAALVAKLLMESAGEHPAVFVLHPDEPAMQDPVSRSQRALGEDEIQLRAVTLASELRDARVSPRHKGSLLPRLNYCQQILTRVQSRLSGAVALEQTIALSAEWVLDNSYIIRGHMEDFRKNLPAQYYRQLPFLVSGPWKSLPRVYAIACEMVSVWDGALTKSGIESFLQAFQSETTLTTAELWALPMMLRLRLIENITTLSSDIERRQSESEHAAFWANRLLYTARREVDRMPEVLAAVASECPRPPPNVVEELLDHLYDEESALTPVRSWLQTKFPSPLEDVVRQEEHLEMANQLSLANAISTLRLLSQFDWSDVFEAVSHVEAILWTDPALVYNAMDFATRDSYRHKIEEMSRRVRMREEEIAEKAISLALNGNEEPTRHIGYYLVDQGVSVLENAIGIRPTMRQRARRAITKNAALCYVSGIAAVTTALVFLALRFSSLVDSPISLVVILAVLFLLPALDLAVRVVNYLVTRALTPRALPKMSFEEGIPDEARTLVIVPMMLLTPDSIRDEVSRLEIRALANPDKNLRFALLSDYADAPQQHMPEDLEMLDVARRGISELNHTYGADRFVLFYREREWSDSESRWMGWERKRGKLEELNRFLVGEPGAEKEIKVGAGTAETFSNIHFVLTLDSDTQLPRDTARRLVATLAHPLNRPRLSTDGRSVTRGYTIIQPRVSTSLPSATSSMFTRMFTDPTGMDPYTHAVSDVYQDLAASGSYHGKGIYDLRAFNSVLSGRFPEAHLLSHDLIEGAYTRVGLASDIELLDLFPENYLAYCSRQQRWIRGDWQIAEWLLPVVPTGKDGKEPNPLPALERWKIFDNLRRTLTPAAVLAMLIGGCALSPRPVVCAMLVLALMLALMLFPLATRLTQRWVFDPIVWYEPIVNFSRSLLFIAALPHQAWLELQATSIALYRVLISHKHLLEWETASGFVKSKKFSGARRTLLRLAWVPLFAVGAAAIVMSAHPHQPFVIVPFAAMWVASPFVLAWLDRPWRANQVSALPSATRANLRQVARKTWRYFDELVGEGTHQLPPDNYQVAHRIEVAERTSPTNIGLYLLSVLTAHDLGYICIDQAIERVLGTMRTIHDLERYRGHLFNWYDTSTLQPLGERYVSSVDSGNLLGSLWALNQGLRELLDRPLIGPQLFRGLNDTFGLVLQHKSGSVASEECASIARILGGRSEHLFEIAKRVRSLSPATGKLLDALARREDVSDKCTYWAQQFQQQVAMWNSFLDRYFSWLPVLEKTPDTGILSLGSNAHAFRREGMSQVPSLRAMASNNLDGVSGLLALQASHEQLAGDVNRWLGGLAKQSEQANAAAKQTFALVENAMSAVNEMDAEMDMSFLYDPERRLIAVGYNINEQRLDRSFYDLLASEARLSSFLAIARGEVPTEHWWMLGRPFGSAYMRRPMLSWSGTMFEYLMPLLLTKSYANSLLDKACRTALDCQMIYARKRGIPWGISESAYSALDSRQVYQYHAFGVPSLALKRGLEDDYVVSPYSSALALAVDPKAAAKHFRRSGVFERLGLWGDYGLFESIDFTRHRGPKGERGIVVHAYMAHHQGMTLVAIANAVAGNVMQERFHADPRVRATASLLYERVPIAPNLVKSYAREAPVARLSPIIAVPGPGRVETPDTPTPRTSLLSNGAYRVMVTNAGGGYSRWNDFDITRWRSDSTADSWGKFYYLKDRETGFVWSTAHQPTGVRTPFYHATFSAEKVEVRRRDRGLEAITEIVVSPEDDAEVCRLTFINRSPRTRRLELTSYAELALADHAADRTHPAFNKLFIETAMLRDLDALLAWRRLRSPDERPIWVAQIMASEIRSHDPTEFETDRAKFIGRGRSVRDPIAMEQPLSGTEGYVLDPILSLRRKLDLAPGERVQVVLVTIAAATREQALALITKYRDPQSANRSFHLAWTQAQLELRHLRIGPADAQLYQALAGHILYPHAHLRASSDRLARNKLGQRNLWAYGISGDLPIVVLTIDELEHIDVVEETLAAHTFWRLRGLKCDLVILNEEATSYDQPLNVELQRMIAARTSVTGVDQPGGVFLRPARQIPPEDFNLILAAAHLVLVAARGPLSQQIGSPAEAPAPPAAPKATAQEEPSALLEPLPLEQSNSVGGFSEDGREYVINLGKDVHTPRPWSNVMANEGFGTFVTDEGSGSTWFGNSQSNRLTTWSNDPISNPSGDAIYIFDASLNTIWTPTALPIRENDGYRVRHGQGYSVVEHNSHAIEQQLTTFVPTDQAGGLPVRIQVLKLTNRSSRRRSLKVSFYAEWTLGADREATQQNIVTSWDLESRSMFARNSFNLSYADMIAFAACSAAVESFTGDRNEVLGRNGSMANPVGLRSRALSGRCGGALDPCAALQTSVELEPNESTEIIFLLGAARAQAEARDIIARMRRPSETQKALQSTRQFWGNVLGALTVETPDAATNLLLNRWLLYQSLSCRIWGRSAFYQSGGAYGFRDQIQDVLSLLYSQPKIARDHIVRCAGRQFLEGDVQHWWHPEAGAGVRTRISDDLLWLPYAVAQYTRVTGDLSILDESVPFLEGRLLDKGEHDAYYVPTISSETGTVWEHCRRAIEKASTSGVHGLPLMGAGDWNDGMNLVGIGGKGESVWLAWFLIHVLRDFSELTHSRNESLAEMYRNRAADLAAQIDETSWDGEWYRRAYFDDGTPLGSKQSVEAKIDSLPQSWAAITGAGNTERAQQAMRSVNEHLVKDQDKLVQLFEPPFDTSPMQPGYIKGYPPGVRENGGQYTHGSLWTAMAWARLGNGTEAVRILEMMNPINLAMDSERYLVEPYVVAADIYSLPGRVGMGGWTWYTGSSAWMYRIWIEEVLGFKLRGNELRIEPVIPLDWQGYKMTFRFGAATYSVSVDASNRQPNKPATITVDGIAVEGTVILLADDGRQHQAIVTL